MCGGETTEVDRCLRVTEVENEKGRGPWRFSVYFRFSVTRERGRGGTVDVGFSETGQRV